MTRFIFTFLIITYGALANANSIVIDKVKFKEFHDPGWMVLTNDSGREIKASFFYSLITYEDIYEWKKDEWFNVILDDTNGVQLERVGTNKQYTVIFEGSYPISIPIDECYKTDGMTNQGIAGCINLETKLLLRNINALHNHLTINANDELRAALTREKAAWNAYQKVRNEAVRSHYFQQQGSSQIIYNAEDGLNQAKHRLDALIRFFK